MRKSILLAIVIVVNPVNAEQCNTSLQKGASRANLNNTLGCLERKSTESLNKSEEAEINRNSVVEKMEKHKTRIEVLEGRLSSTEARLNQVDLQISNLGENDCSWGHWARKPSLSENIMTCADGE